MSDERVVWDAPIGQVRTNGKFRRHPGVTWDSMTQAGLIEDLARALAESEAKVARMEWRLRSLEDFYRRELDSLPNGADQ